MERTKMAMVVMGIVNIFAWIVATITFLSDISYYTVSECFANMLACDSVIIIFVVLFVISIIVIGFAFVTDKHKDNYNN